MTERERERERERETSRFHLNHLARGIGVGTILIPVSDRDLQIPDKMFGSDK